MKYSAFVVHPRSQLVKIAKLIGFNGRGIIYDECIPTDRAYLFADKLPVLVIQMAGDFAVNETKKET